MSAAADRRKACRPPDLLGAHQAPEPLPAIVDAAEELGPQTVLLPDGRQVVVIMLDEFAPRREAC
jgi:hypothetical protein